MNCYPVWFMERFISHVRHASRFVGKHARHAVRRASVAHWSVKLVCVGGPLIALTPLLPLPHTPWMPTHDTKPQPVRFSDRGIGGTGQTAWAPTDTRGNAWVLDQPKGGYSDLAYFDAGQMSDIKTNEQTVFELPEQPVSEPSSLFVFGFGTLLTILIRKVRNFC